MQCRVLSLAVLCLLGYTRAMLHGPNCKVKFSHIFCFEFSKNSRLYARRFDGKVYTSLSQDLRGLSL